MKKIVSLLLICSLILLCACGSQTDNVTDEPVQQTVKYSVPAGLVKKTETVYVNLDNYGTATQTIVSDWIHTDRAEVYVDDITNLSEIENIKDDSAPDISGNNLRWYMNTTDLYYQGKSEAKLPVEFELSYALDGIPMVPEEMIGKDGNVEITIKMHNVDSYNVKVNGRNTTMYNPMLVIGGVTMAESKFQNITVKNGRTTGNGNSQLAVLVGFPGINDSLGLTDLSSGEAESAYTFDDTFTITADVKGFELGNFMFAAIPIASLDIGLNNISDSMDDVRDTLKKLQSIQKTLQNMNADQLLGTLTSNPDKLKNLSSVVSQAASLYDSNKALIDVINKYTNPSNMQTISYLTSYISQADFDGLENALGVINSIFGDEASAETIQSGLALLRAMSEDLKNPEVKSAIDNLPQTVSTLNSLQSVLNENKDLIDALKILSESDALASLDTSLSGFEGSLAAGGISQYANITGNADEITAKMTAWIELGKRYTIFTKKTDSMSSSIMFVFKVDGLKQYSASKNISGSTNVKDSDEASFFNRLFN